MPKQKAKSKIPFRNQNQTGWWIYGEVEQWVSDRQRKLTVNSRCLVWENTRILRAKSREEAYAKAMRRGRESLPSRTFGGEWRFAGISMLLPIYDEIADGAELLWESRGKMTQKNLQRLVKEKGALPVFDDSDGRT